MTDQDQQNPLKIVKMWLQDGVDIGRSECTPRILRQLARRCGTLPTKTTHRVRELPFEQLNRLAEALLDFSSAADLERWLTNELGTPEAMELEKEYKDGLREGYQEGFREGFKEGRQEGSSFTITRVLSQRLKHVPTEIAAAIRALEVGTLDRMTDVLLGFETLSEVREWLSSARPSSFRPAWIPRQP